MVFNSYVVKVFYEWTSFHPATSIAIAFLSWLFLYYVTRIVQPPLVLCGNSKYRNFLFRKCPSLSRNVWLTFPICFMGGALQTLLFYFARVADFMYREWKSKRTFQSEILHLSDGGQVVLDWVQHNKNLNISENSPILLLLPGLSGNCHTGFIHRLIMQGESLKFRCVGFNFRGNFVPLVTPKVHSFCDTTDLKEVVYHIKQRYPTNPLIAFGTSCGGIVLGHYLSQYGEDCKLDGAILWSAPFDTSVSIKLNKTFLTYHLSIALTKDLREMVKRNEKIFENTGIDLDQVYNSRTIPEFDEAFVSKIHGYKDVDDYYRHSSLRGKLDTIRVPTLAITALDDFLQPVTHLPTENELGDSSLAIVATSVGGHVGGLEGYLMPRFYPHILSQEFMTAIVEQYVTAENNNK